MQSSLCALWAARYCETDWGREIAAARDLDGADTRMLLRLRIEIGIQRILVLYGRRRIERNTALLVVLLNAEVTSDI